jgi:hypothetical protein
MIESNKNPETGKNLATADQAALAAKIDVVREFAVAAGEHTASVKLRHAIESLNCASVVEVKSVAPSEDAPAEKKGKGSK